VPFVVPLFGTVGHCILKEVNMNFDTLGLHEVLARAVADAGYTETTEVQSRAIPLGLKGADLMVSSSTGSGKTAAFILPALQGILDARADNDTRREKGVVYGPRVLVLCPTRELAMQVAKAASTYGRHVQGLRVATVLGGVPYPLQIKALRGPLDILIATPGRLLDHLQSGKAVLDNVQMLVLDEADRMLDMGFIDDIRTIADRVPATRQTVMFSATFAGHVGRLAQDLLRNPERVEVSSHTDTHENIEQRLHWADSSSHKDQLLEHLLADKSLDQAVVFTSTQRDADWLAERLYEIGHSVAPLHGGMPQGRRNRTLMALRRGELRVLVATDVAARGIDVPTISHVINYGLPMKAEDYVHRIGRTGRAGRNGLAVTLAERGDVSMIRRIQQFTTQNIPAGVIEGLEPKMPEPRMYAARPEGATRPAGKPYGNKPSYGGKPSYGAKAGFGGKPSFNKSGGAPFNRDGGAPFNREGGESRFAPAPGAGDSRRGAGFGDRAAPRGDSFGGDRGPRGAGGPGARTQRPRTGGYSR